MGKQEVFSRRGFSLESLSLSTTASVDNVGILYKMIHFSGVVIGKKTDKFYLSREEEKFMSFCARDSKKVYFFFLPHRMTGNNIYNIRLITVDLSATRAATRVRCKMEILNSIFLSWAPATVAVRNASISMIPICFFGTRKFLIISPSTISHRQRLCLHVNIRRRNFPLLHSRHFWICMEIEFKLCFKDTPKRHEKDCFWGFPCEKRRMSPEKGNYMQKASR